MVAKVQLVFQLALGLVFLFSTTGKLRDATGFSRGIAEYKIVPSVLVHPVALLVILAEACLALTHLTGLLLGLAAPFGFFMLIGFAAAVGVNLRRGRTLSCHCFGTADGETISRRTLARLLMLLFAEWTLLPHEFRTVNRFVYPGQVASMSELVFALSWAMLSLIGASWLLTLPDLWSLVRFSRIFGTR